MKAGNRKKVRLEATWGSR